MPVEEAKDVEDVDADPDEEVPDGGQHEELLEDEVIDSEHQRQPHGQLI